MSPVRTLSSIDNGLTIKEMIMINQTLLITARKNNSLELFFAKEF